MSLRFFALLLSAATARPEALHDILARLDKSAATFHGMSAKIRRTDYTAVLGDTSDSTGAVRLKRTPAGLLGVIEFSEPDVKFVELRDRQVTIFYPMAKVAEIYDVRKYGEQLDQFLLLGFGTSGAELNKIYSIKVAGTDQLAAGKATRLELVPKSGEARNYLTRIELWIPEGASYPLQEKLYEKSNDYKLIVYSDLKLNPGLPDSAFLLRLPAEVKKIYPTK